MGKPFYFIAWKSYWTQKGKSNPIHAPHGVSIPKELQMFKTVKLFTGQGGERNNDFARATVLRKSNKWDGPGDVLKHDARQWELRDRERGKGKYNKQDNMYW